MCSCFGSRSIWLRKHTRVMSGRIVAIWCIHIEAVSITRFISVGSNSFPSRGSTMSSTLFFSRKGFAYVLSREKVKQQSLLMILNKRVSLTLLLPMQRCFVCWLYQQPYDWLWSLEATHQRQTHQSSHQQCRVWSILEPYTWRSQWNQRLLNPKL